MNYDEELDRLDNPTRKGAEYEPRDYQARARRRTAPTYENQPHSSATRRSMSYDEYMAEQSYEGERSYSRMDYDGNARRRREDPYARPSAYHERAAQARRRYDDDAYDDEPPRGTYRASTGSPSPYRASGSRASGSHSSGYHSSGYRASAPARRRSGGHTGRNVALVMLVAVLAVMIPFTIKSGLFGGPNSPGPLGGGLGAVPSAEVPFDDVFATPEATAVPVPTMLPTFAPTEAPTEAPGRVLDPGKKAIALTFDDGPSKYTREILAALAEVDGRATFFVVGERLDDYSETLQMVYESGCQIGMHTYDHKNLTKLSTSKIHKEIDDTNDLIYQYVGEYSRLVRPPYGSVNSTVKETVEQPLINWSLDTRDWESRNADSVFSEIMSNVEDGDIVLMHDLYSSTAEAVKRAVPALVEQGYQLCTVEELFELKGIELHSGTVFRSAKQSSD